MEEVPDLIKAFNVGKSPEGFQDPFIYEKDGTLWIRDDK